MATTAKRQKRQPTPKQAQAIEAWLEGGRSKGEAMREVGYSKAVSLQPGKVFNSPAVQTLLDAAGINPVEIIERLNKKAYAKHLKSMRFEGDYEMSDSELKALFEDEGMRVFRVRHSDDSRTVYYFADNDMINLEAIEKIINLYGLYAPKKTETKATLGIWSMSDLRNKMRENALPIIDQPHGENS